MAFVPAPGIVTLAAIMSWQGQRCENTFNYRLPGAIDLTVMRAMAQTYVDWFIAHENDFSNTVGLELIYVRDLTTQSGATLDFVPLAAADGNRASPSVPNNCTLAIKRQTGRAGRANRGRIYHIGLTEDLRNANNTILSGSATGIAADYEVLRQAQITDNTAHEVILHRKLGTGTDVVGYLVTDFVIDSQRRRLPGHNRHH